MVIGREWISIHLFETQQEGRQIDNEPDTDRNPGGKSLTRIPEDRKMNGYIIHIGECQILQTDFIRAGQ